MELKDVEEFAKKNGFDKVKYIGRYKKYEVYKPLHNTDMLIGLPFYILVDNNRPKLITGDLGLKILDYFNK